MDVAEGHTPRGKYRETDAERLPLSGRRKGTYAEGRAPRDGRREAEPVSLSLRGHNREVEEGEEAAAERQLLRSRDSR